MNRFTAALAATAAALVSALPLAAPAAAQQDVVPIPEGQTHCPDGYVCLFRDYEFQGGGYAVAAPGELPWFGDIGFNDRMSSWANDSGITYCWYFDAYYSGEEHVMYDGYRVNVLPRENDHASSLRPC
jgi:hypothetical protein